MMEGSQPAMVVARVEIPTAAIKGIQRKGISNL
jgi:hypothetical protein